MTAGGVTAIIPARLESRRFPGKVLHRRRGKPLLFYVWDTARRCGRIDRVAIATDTTAVAQAAAGFGATVVRTSGRHRTGSDRAAEAAARLGGEIIVNLQADVFGLRPSVLGRVIGAMEADPSIRCATLARPVSDDRELFNPDRVKVVVSASGEALWFSRWPLPYLKGVSRGRWTGRHRYLVHIGVYVYRRTTLRTFARLKRTAAERAESLEQLRLLEHRIPVRVFTTRTPVVSVDRPGDLRTLDRLLQRGTG